MLRKDVCLAVVIAMLPAAAWAADATGRMGTISLLDVNHATAETYLQYHGRVVIQSDAGADTYRWGGTSCSNKSLSESKVSMLQQAMESGATIEPRFQPGQGSNKCLVGFTLVVP